jgi:hypothetical protein
LSDELLKKHDANVVVVDWNGGSGPPYAQAVANIRLVGRAVAIMIIKLRVSNYFIVSANLITDIQFYFCTMCKCNLLPEERAMIMN